MSPLLGVTYAEFDNTVGPKLLYAYPADAMPKERFEALSDYVIVGKHLCKKIIVIQNDGIKYMNYSMAIDNPKYERNALLFSLGFVLPVDADTEPFEPILRKFAAVLLALENEREYLFYDASKAQLQGILQRLYVDLVSRGETFLPLDESNVVAGKVFETPRRPLEIPDYRVPVLRFSKMAQINVPWDISLNFVLNRIDGVSYVRKIASKRPAVDMECVRRCLRTLIYYDCVILADIVQLSNVYVLEGRHRHHHGGGRGRGRGRGSTGGKPIWETVAGPGGSDVLRDVVEFASVGLPDGVSAEQLAQRSASVTNFLFKFRGAKQLGQVLLSCGPGALVGMDLRRLMAVVQDRGLLRRLHEYPVYVGRPPAASSSTSFATESTLPLPLPLQQQPSALALAFAGRSSTDSIGRYAYDGLPGTRELRSSVTTVPSHLQLFAHDRDNHRDHSPPRHALYADAPVTANDNGAWGSLSTPVDELKNLLDGSVCLDRLCCDFGVSSADMLGNPDQFYIVYR